jgi:hypothetical protein
MSAPARNHGNCLVECSSCHHKKLVVFGECLKTGWPKCCGFTMRLISQPHKADIEAAVREMFYPLAPAGGGGAC